MYYIYINIYGYSTTDYLILYNHTVCGYTVESQYFFKIEI